MWSTMEDSRRYSEIRYALLRTLQQHVPLRGSEPVSVEDIALYLEWMELLLEVAPSVRPFLDKSCPYDLQALTYRQMAADFVWLTREALETRALLPA